MKRILLVAAMAALWSSCSDNDLGITSPPRTNEILIAPAIVSVEPAPEARTLITGTTASWINGDAIGLFCPEITASNVQFTATGAGAAAVWSTSTPIYWRDAVTDHHFTAYYPYAAANTSAGTIAVPAINTQTGVLTTAMDMLISNNLNSSGVKQPAGAVGLTFTHAFTLLQFNFVLGSGVLPASTLISYTVAGGSSEKLYTTDAASTVALSSGTMTVGAGTNTMTVTPTVPPVLTAVATSLYAVIVPGTYAGPTLTVVFKDGGVTQYTTTATPLGTTVFAGGTKYTYTVTLSRNTISISNPTINEWANGTGGSLNPGF